jgi:hypothetical protein
MDRNSTPLDHKNVSQNEVKYIVVSTTFLFSPFFLVKFLSLFILYFVIYFLFQLVIEVL